MTELTKGYVEINTTTIKNTCTQILNTIKTLRKQHKKDHIKQQTQTNINNNNYWWNKIWKHLNYKQPTTRQAIKQAINQYYNDGTNYTPSARIKDKYTIQEKTCQDLIKATKLTTSQTIWITIETAHWLQ